ncbi:hypothetical protein WH47_10330, partial [Habropoda laboriosa]
KRFDARRVLERQFPNRWIVRGSNISWPAHPPDLTPLNYLLCGALKNKVYRQTSTTVEDMRELILIAFAHYPITQLH